MSLDLRLNEQNDIDFAGGAVRLCDGAEQVSQQIRVLLRTFIGEWFLDTTHGIPYLEKVHVKAPNRAEIETILRKKIKEIPLVSSVSKMSLQIDHPARMFYVEADVETEQGLVTVKVGV